MLILGSTRFFIDNMWGITMFGKFSLALSLTNFFLLFISQVSMVLFPALKRSKKQQQYQVYSFSRNALGLLLPTIFLTYMPMKYLLGLWLPQYKESFGYLALLLPLCTFDGKMNLLCNTYFKVLRKEKFLLVINLLTMILNIILSYIGAFVLENIYIVIVFMIVSIAFRSIVSELYLAKIMKVNIVSNLIQEIFLVAFFMICTWFTSTLYAFTIFFILYILYIFINRNEVVNLFKHIKCIL